MDSIFSNIMDPSNLKWPGSVFWKAIRILAKRGYGGYPDYTLASSHSLIESMQDAVALDQRLPVRTPQPAQGIRQDRAAVLAIVFSVPAHELVVIAAVTQCSRHLEIGKPPVPIFVIQVSLAILQKDPQRPQSFLADARRVDVPATDVSER